MGNRCPVELGGLAPTREGGEEVVVERHVLEHPIQPLNVPEVGISKPLPHRSAPPGIVGPHRHQAVRLRVGQGPEHDPVHHTVDGRAPANAQGQRQDGHQGKHGILAKDAEPVADVRPNALEYADATHVPHLLLESIHSPERDHGLSVRLLGRHSAFQVLLRLHGHVELQLVVDVVLGAAQGPEGLEQKPKRV